MSDLFDDVKDSNVANSSTNIQKVPIYEEMKQSYLDYAMSVIVSRALPDIRDGLKPVHRRIIYTMYDSGFYYNRPYKKSARIVGDVMGKYHPHGDSAIYDALVRMAQDFSLRLPLIDGQGNFGSIDGDNAAAMRYTEARMAQVAHYLIDDIDKETVDFKRNYDDSLEEPSVIPAKYPNLLVNGASGIAVGMATNIPTHNLGELIDASIMLIENEESTIEELLEVIQGPDFPTGARILGKKGIYDAFHTGRGSITICGVASIEENKHRSNIIITEIPWMVNKSKLVEEIAKIKDKSDSKELDVISSVRDESDRHGIRIVVELKKDAEPEIVINYLQKYTSFQTYFGINMLAIDSGIPKLLNIKQILIAFLDFRKVVVKRRTSYLLKKARDKAHLLVGLGVSVENIDEMIEIIKESPSPAIARERLMKKSWRAGSITPYIELLDEKDRTVINGMYYLSEIQAKGILDLRLHRLTGLEREKIQSDLKELSEHIKDYLNILSSQDRLMEIIRSELLEVKNFATPRRTSIENKVDSLSEEDFIQKEEVTVTLTNSGYIKRMPVTSYRIQKRGGRGKIGINTKERDVVTDILITNSHADLLFFTSKGLVYKLKCYKIPESSPTSLGRAIVNLLPIEKGEIVTSVLQMENTSEDHDIIFATKYGGIRRNKFKDFMNIPSRGKIAIKLEEGDALIGTHLCNESNDVLVTATNGQCLRFPVKTLRVFSSRNSSGVRAIKLDENNYVINVSILQHEKIENIEVREEYLKFASAKRRGENFDFNLLNNNQIISLEEKEEFILTVTSNGFGKRTSAYDYRITQRGGKGFLGAKLSSKIGYIVASFVIKEDDEIIIISNKGQVIRQKIKDIRITSRVSAGVKLFKIDSDEFVVSVSKVKSLDEEGVEEDQITNNDSPL